MDKLWNRSYEANTTLNVDKVQRMRIEICEAVEDQKNIEIQQMEKKLREEYENKIQQLQEEVEYNKKQIDELLNNNETKDFYQQNRKLTNVMKFWRLFIDENRVKELPDIQLPKMKWVEVNLKKESEPLKSFLNDSCPESLELFQVSKEDQNRGEFCKISFYFNHIIKWIENTKNFVEAILLEFSSSELCTFIKSGPK